MRLLIALLALFVAGCVSHSTLQTGEQAVGDRMLLTLDGPWNYIDAPGMGPARTWTMEGLPIDVLRVYSGIKDEQSMHPKGPAGQKNFSFRSTMQPDEVVAMFEGVLTRDGSSFKLAKLEPTTFAGEKGFRFEYSLTRKVDNVQLSGLGYGVVSNGELFAMLYQAPRLAFFARHQPRVDQIARSARLSPRKPPPS